MGYGRYEIIPDYRRNSSHHRLSDRTSITGVRILMAKARIQFRRLQPV